MHLTRRTFLSTSLAAGLLAAAEATRSHWLLTSMDPIRIGLVNLDEGATEHLAVFSAIPGAEIAALLNPSGGSHRAAIAEIHRHGRPRPAVYRDLDQMMKHPSLHMFSLSGRRSTPISLLTRIVAAGFPLIADIPHEVPSSNQTPALETLLSAKTPVLFRTNYFADPTTVHDVHKWLLRSSAKHVEATLTVPLRAGEGQLCRAGVISLAALLCASELSPESLPEWMHAESRRIHVAKGIPAGSVPIPSNAYGIRYLNIRSYGGNPTVSTLALDHTRGSIRVPIKTCASPEGCLRTTMHFLTRVRFPKEVDNADSIRAQVASILMQSFHDCVRT